MNGFAYVGLADGCMDPRIFDRGPTMVSPDDHDPQRAARCGNPASDWRPLEMKQRSAGRAILRIQ
ncbi:hypothetical protein N7481_007606 [Penicillium waksmanii]|uniref:uncharacterized protein n=1 Tax=Penicillium waksmanii TaxID=69791 RepID=UPI002548187D|nr:uncharacterized protein N7481_007606 [Penicillium waksmanii]KAJ5980308.1 hypothetical protein N7481_007606 [Penicillium waksmanii]